MKIDFTLGELWQIEDALDHYIQSRESMDDPIRGLVIESLKELRIKVRENIHLIRLGEVKDDA